jgi:hypothetical protein
VAGKSILDFLPPEHAAAHRADAEKEGQGWRVKPIPAAVFRVARPDDAARIDRQAVDHPANRALSVKLPFRSVPGERIEAWTDEVSAILHGGLIEAAAAASTSDPRCDAPAPAISTRSAHRPA